MCTYTEIWNELNYTFISLIDTKKKKKLGFRLTSVSAVFMSALEGDVKFVFCLQSFSVFFSSSLHSSLSFCLTINPLSSLPPVSSSSLSMICDLLVRFLVFMGESPSWVGDVFFCFRGEAVLDAWFLSFFVLWIEKRLF